MYHLYKVVQIDLLLVNASFAPSTLLEILMILDAPSQIFFFYFLYCIVTDMPAVQTLGSILLPLAIINHNSIHCLKNSTKSKLHQSYWMLRCSHETQKQKHLVKLKFLC